MTKRKNSKKTNSSIIAIIIILLSFVYGVFSEEINTSFGLPINNISSNVEKNKTSKSPNIDPQNELDVYFLDVGQADSILIKSKDEYMLIDGGNNNDGPLLVNYFKSLGIENFKYIVGTHPHEDHIGGLDDIIDNFNVNTIYIPDAITTTKTFEDLLDSIERKNLTYNVPKIDSTFYLGEAKFKVIYTSTNTSDLNNTSIVLKMTYGNKSFLFTGDATSKTEKIIENKDIKADILKVGHHGSKYSSTDNFLEKVDPKYAIISVGKNNIYNHPEKTTLSKFEEKNIIVYRTDEDGTILAKSDGTNLNLSTIKTNTDGG